MEGEILNKGYGGPDNKQNRNGRQADHYEGG